MSAVLDVEALILHYARQANHRFLQLCSVDLPVDKVVAFEAFFNGTRDGALHHWCCPSCNCGCETEAQAQDMAWKLVASVTSCYPDVPLLYRWKHFEGALAYCHRNFGFGNILRGALQIANSKLPVIDPRALAQDWGVGVVGKVAVHIGLVEQRHT
jgi:hypothetical protein